MSIDVLDVARMWVEVFIARKSEFEYIVSEKSLAWLFTSGFRVLMLSSPIRISSSFLVKNF